MTLLDRYILKEWLKVFVMATGAMVGLLLIGQVFDSMPDFLRWKTGAGKVALYYFGQIPAMMPIVLPVATLISMLFVLGHLHKNQELTAMRAAGLSMRRITRTLWCGGAACTLMLMVFNAAVIPGATESTRTLYEKAKFANESKSSPDASAGEATPAVFFDNGRDAHRWRIGRLAAYTGHARSVQVFELSAEGAPLSQIFAEEADYDAKRGFWTFKHGRRFNYTENGTSTPEQTAFTTLEMPAYTEKPIHMLLMTKKPSGLSLGEIDTLLTLAGDLQSAKTAALAVRYHSILASPFGCLIVVGLAIPFAVAGVRTNPMVGVSKAIGIFALYFLLDKVSYALGSQQIIPVVLAAWIPNIIALGFAFYFCRKVD